MTRFGAESAGAPSWDVDMATRTNVDVHGSAPETLSARETASGLGMGLAALFLTSAVGAAPKDGPTVSLSVAQSDFSPAQDVLVTVTFSNPHKHTVRVLKWFTAVEGMEEQFEAIGKELGELLKRSKARKAEVRNKSAFRKIGQLAHGAARQFVNPFTHIFGS